MLENFQNCQGILQKTGVNLICKQLLPQIRRSCKFHSRQTSQVKKEKGNRKQETEGEKKKRKRDGKEKRIRPKLIFQKSRNFARI